MKNFTSEEIRFSGNSIKSCVVFIDVVDSTKNTITMDNLEHIRIYYSKFINSLSEIVKSYGGKVIKNMGDSLLLHFPKTSDNKNEKVFREVIECSLEILDARHVVNQELSKQHLPPFSYRISMDFGVLDLALVGDYSQIDLFGSTVNLCSKINSSSPPSIVNQIIIGDNCYRILKSFSNIANDYNFISNGGYKITETFVYSTYSIKRVNKLSLIDDSSITSTLRNKLLGYSTDDFIDTKNKKDLFFHERNNNKKKIILVDDDPDILLTYESFLNESGYEIISFSDSANALNYIKDLSNFDNLLVTLDIRMKDLNGFQLHQQIKAIDPTIKILFITVLDISDEILTIVPGLTKEQILIKPVEKKVLLSTIKKLSK
jgi:CheY-like chemotaxis protein/class 3 adenylate cyclase